MDHRGRVLYLIERKGGTFFHCQVTMVTAWLPKDHTVVKTEISYHRKEPLHLPRNLPSIGHRCHVHTFPHCLARADSTCLDHRDIRNGQNTVAYFCFIHNCRPFSHAITHVFSFSPCTYALTRSPALFSVHARCILFFLLLPTPLHFPLHLFSEGSSTTNGGELWWRFIGGQRGQYEYTSLWSSFTRKSTSYFSCGASFRCNKHKAVLARKWQRKRPCWHPLNGDLFLLATLCISKCYPKPPQIVVEDHYVHRLCDLYFVLFFTPLHLLLPFFWLTRRTPKV